MDLPRIVEALRPIDRPEDRECLRDALGLPHGSLVVFAGRLHRQRGVNVLLTAWREVHRRFPEASLAVVRVGPEADALRSPARSGGPSGHTVTFSRHSTRASDALAAADVVVLPPRWEGLSLVLLEAMAARACIVATDVDGAGEAPGSGTTLVAPGEVKGLADAAIGRLADAEGRAAAGRAARTAAVTEFDVRETRDRVRRLYVRMLRAGR